MTDYQLPQTLPTACFRTYDIRGPVEKDALTPNVAYALGLAMGAEAIAHHETQVLVARDGRLSGQAMSDALCCGLRETGINVIFIGIVPSPVLYFATCTSESTQTGIMVTASHNPGHHNGFKIVLAGVTLSTDGIQKLYRRIEQKNWKISPKKGDIQTICVQKEYCDSITKRLNIQRPLKVVLDAGNGAAGTLAPIVFKALGCDVVPLFCEINGHFPNHHPDPTIPDNLKDLIKTVKETKADIGLAFDGDGDRVGVVTNQGNIIWPDQQMMLYAKDVLSQHPEQPIIYDVKCSMHLADVITQYGGKPVMWKTGHSLIKAKLFELEAPLAGEMSGHIFFRDNWFGFDDGLYVGARLLDIISKTDQTVQTCFDQFPQSVHTPELKLPMPEHKKAAFIKNFSKKMDTQQAKKITLDGLRLEFDDGWALIRPSNTSPYLTLRFEATSTQALKDIQHLFSEAIVAIDPTLKLPF